MTARPMPTAAIHIGHALQQDPEGLRGPLARSPWAMMCDYVPGWDCHGLPIEWKIEEELRAKGRRKDEVSKAEFRSRCRTYADHWIGVQMDGFKRLGVLGDWANRYATMDYRQRGHHRRRVPQVRRCSGQLYRGSKPVMWSPVERTALADAEVEYHDHNSPTVWVKFPVVEGPSDASVVIWTTTPWTIPANRAISFSEKISYGLYEVSAMETGLEFEPWAKAGDRLIVADKLADDVAKSAKIAAWTRLDGRRSHRHGLRPSPGGLRSLSWVQGAPAGRRSRHRRRRYGFRPHRPWSRPG